MGYVLPERLAVVEFGEYPGLEVTVRLSPVPMGLYFDILSRLQAIGSDMLAMREVCELFAPLGLVKWNLPEPADADGLAAQPFELAFGIVVQWTKAVAEVPLPLPVRSSDGVPSEGPETSPST